MGPVGSTVGAGEPNVDTTSHAPAGYRSWSAGTKAEKRPRTKPERPIVAPVVIDREMADFVETSRALHEDREAALDDCIDLYCACVSQDPRLRRKSALLA